MSAEVERLRADVRAAYAERDQQFERKAAALRERDEARRELAGAQRERDLAIAHDRQPYPTAWAHEQALKALETQRARAEKAEAERDALKAAIERERQVHDAECDWCVDGCPCPVCKVLDALSAPESRLNSPAPTTRTETP